MHLAPENDQTGHDDPINAPTIDDLSGNPHPHLARLRAEGPVAWVPALGAFLVTGWAAATEVLRDPATFTVDDPRFSTARVVGPSMLSTDGSEHARHRRPFVAPFRAGRVIESSGDRIRDEVARLVAALVAGPRRAELRTALAGPLATSTVAFALGLEGTQIDDLRRWYHAIVGSVSAVGAGGPVTAEGADAMVELDAELRRQLSITTGPPTLMIDALHAGLAAGEVVSNAAVIMFGGIDTTEGMLLNVLWNLLVQPDAWTAVRRDAGLMPVAVEEALRLEPGAAVVDRYATRDVVLAGTEIAAGAPVTVSLAGANRDPAEFADPDRFDLHRPRPRHHLAFAAGPHVCIGAELARLEITTAVSALVEALPELRLASDAPPPTGLVFRKPERLPVEWDL